MNIIHIALSAAVASVISVVSIPMSEASGVREASGVVVQHGNVAQSKVLQSKVQKQFAADTHAAVIRSRADLDEYIKQNSSRSLLNALPSKQRTEFLNSLNFSHDGGVASFNYAVLKGLPEKQLRSILELFGLQSLVPLASGMAVPEMAPTYLKGYKCVGHGGPEPQGHTCVVAEGYACTINC